MPAIKDRVEQASASTGTGNLTLTAAIAGRVGFASAHGTGSANTFYYMIEHALDGSWEKGIGYMLDATTLVRQTVLGNSLGTTAKIDFAAGGLKVLNSIIREALDAILPVGTVLRAPAAPGSNWLACNGSTYLQSAYPALFSALGLIANGQPGATWTQRTSSFGASGIYGVCFGNGQFVAVGESGKLATSPDGINWTQRTSSFGTDGIYAGVTYGGGTFVAAGTTKIATSPDGINWTQRTPPNLAGEAINGVCYGNGQFVVVGTGGKIATSPDGVTWTLRATSFGTVSFNKVAYANGLFVAVGDGISGFIATSPDGITWTSRTTNVAANLYGIAYGNGLFVAVGGNGAVTTSADGLTWTSRTSGLSAYLYCIGFGGGVFVAGGESGKLATSPDGISWTVRTHVLGTVIFRGAAYGADLFVVVNQSGTLATSAGYTYNSATEFAVPNLATEQRLNHYIKAAA